MAAPWLAERENWPLWLPVLTGGGVVLYFQGLFEVELWQPLAGLAVLLVGAVAAYRRFPALVPLLAALIALLAGVTAIQFRSQMVAAPVLERPLAMVLLSGEVADVEPLANEGTRVVLEKLFFENRQVTEVPEKVRIRLPPHAPNVRPGQRIRLYASLMPPAGPAYPGGFDFARTAWYQKLGGVGYGMGKVEIVETDRPMDASVADMLSLWMADIRLVITRRILDALEGDSGAVSAALITGGERAISKPLLDAYRDSGLAHLLSVSGLHISLVAGLVFVGLRALLALCGPLALRFPIKKWTAVGAMLAALFYLFVSGAFVPTQRSFLMTGIVLLGVVLDRQAISMRLVAWAALAILLTQPESLLGASFQMSFAAVLALIAVYDIVHGPVLTWRRHGGWWRGFVLYVAMLALSSLVAGLATAPFAIESFNRFNPYGLVSNMIAVPLSGVLVMPAALAAVLLMPLGLEQLALTPMGWGVDLINLVAYEVASWPGAGLAVPAFSPAGFLAIVAGGLWLLLMRRNWRWLGLAAALFGLSTMATTRLPDILVDGGTGLAAVRLDDGRMLVTPGRKESITREAWRRYLAQDGEPEPFADGAGEGRMVCDSLSCRINLKGVDVAFAAYPEALAEDCRSSPLLVAPFTVPGGDCQGPVILDRRFRLRNGPSAIWLEAGAVKRLETLKGQSGRHPWVREKAADRRRPDAAPDDGKASENEEGNGQEDGLPDDKGKPEPKPKPKPVQ